MRKIHFLFIGVIVIIACSFRYHHVNSTPFTIHEKTFSFHQQITTPKLTFTLQSYTVTEEANDEIVYHVKLRIKNNTKQPLSSFETFYINPPGQGPNQVEGMMPRDGNHVIGMLKPGITYEGVVDFSLPKKRVTASNHVIDLVFLDDAHARTVTKYTLHLSKKNPHHS
ncbi:hypothetical protein A374_06086 [Fictibacillus macauensis ZFHKF-1]|uniref:DUF4352 domain-containing protein n=1 Tax=Fictibacillus macauensis ZFHKF-1 TaxID=1196324 RepID=I8UGW6_9BACL|nr:hypothetical protein [Fictibacillus macauensis]EIT86145.1 hypothetical protein A374_06086 [Fictibacillus macauensis ZFHKF-1]